MAVFKNRRKNQTILIGHEKKMVTRKIRFIERLYWFLRIYFSECLRQPSLNFGNENYTPVQ